MERTITWETLGIGLGLAVLVLSAVGCPIEVKLDDSALQSLGVAAQGGNLQDELATLLAAREDATTLDPASGEKGFMLDAETLQAIAALAGDLPPDQMLEVIYQQLNRMYPDTFAPLTQWMPLHEGESPVGQLVTLYQSPKEYLIFFGVSRAAEQYLGMNDADVYTFLMSGQLQAYLNGEADPLSILAGDTLHLGGGATKDFEVPQTAWMLEYGRIGE
jgi:C-8 sterol isomerase